MSEHGAALEAGGGPVSANLTPDERLRLHTAIDWCYPPTDEATRRAVDHIKVCEEVERILDERLAPLLAILREVEEDRTGHTLFGIADEVERRLQQ